jgi:hypothetical protein
MMTIRLATRAARMAALTAAVVCPALLLAPAAAAQAPAWSAGSGAYFERYGFGDDAATGLRSVSLLTVPFGAALRPVSWLNVDLSGAFATATAVRSDDSESSISGLTDTALQLSVPVLENRVVVAAAFIAPTGKSTYSQDEAQVAGIIAADLLPFRISNWGSGGGIDLSSSVAASTGSVNVAARVGYQLSREFDLLEEGEFRYQPGNQLYVRVGADRSIGDSRAAAQVTVYRFGEDALNSQNLYQSGNRIQGLLSYAAPLGRRGRAQAYAGAQHRQRGVFLDGSADTPSQTLLLLGAGVRQPLGAGILVPSADLRLLRSADGLNQGFIGGVGTAYELPLAGGTTTLLPTARVRFGNLLISDGVESGITGVELGAALRFGSRR